MTIELQYKLRSSQIYLEYLRNHSYWYKYLNRSSNSFKEFEEKVKENYHLRPIDRINKTIDTIDMVSTIISSLKS